MTDRGATAVREAPFGVVAVAFAAAVVALAGGFWDDAWHTERGRDEFFAPPHIAIYAGIATAGGALTLWAALAVRAGAGLRSVLGHKPLALALLSVAVTLASGPIDNFWHEAFGKDAVIWSPPHMLGIAGTLALGAAILAEVAHADRRRARWATPIAGALVLASAAFAVVEYDTDIPQFDTLWYLPALALCAAIAFAIILLANDRPYAATEAAVVHLAFAAAVALFLVAIDFPTPGMPLLIPAALALDLTARRRWPTSARAGAFALVLYATYVPTRNWAGEGVRFDASDVAVGLPIAIAAAWVVLAVAAREMHIPRRGGVSATSTALLLVVLLVLTAAPTALAHDPGQGKDAGQIALDATARDRTITLTGRADRRSCRGLAARSVAARRGGQTLRAPLAISDCRLTGRIEVPERGRWFVYAELRRDGRNIEAWLPVQAGDGTHRTAEPDRYAYEPDNSAAGAGQIVAGVILYAAMAALVVATFALVRQASRRSA